ncbi:MAG: alpha/beta hydrolase [Melioribacteraceae bacterium]|nr:alpha/beta hydrolase [Melioribacteraceae bacterium]
MRFEKTEILVVLFLIFSNTIFTQAQIDRDTSFTLKDTYLKVVKEFPYTAIPMIPDSSTFTKYENQIYDNTFRDLHIDIYSPKNVCAPIPLIIIIHGGGWRSGSKEMERPLAKNLTQHGLCTATVEYRLSPEAKYPAGVVDLKKAIKWIKKNSTGYGIDSSKIILLGGSAGGTLAALLGVTANHKIFDGMNYYPEISTGVCGIINIDGIVDFSDPAESGKDTIPAKPSAGKLWFGASYSENPNIWNEASPLNYVDKQTPPILFINSAQKRFRAGRDEFIKKLNVLNKYSQVVEIDNSPHPFWLFEPWFSTNIKLITDFVKKITARA